MSGSSDDAPLALTDVVEDPRLLWMDVVLPRLGYGWLGSAFDGSEAVA
jgi:hypothetical protein